MAIQKKTLPTKNSDHKPEATAATPKAGKPSAEVSASESVTPSMIVSGM